MGYSEQTQGIFSGIPLSLAGQGVLDAPPPDPRVPSPQRPSAAAPARQRCPGTARPSRRQQQLSAALPARSELPGHAAAPPLSQEPAPAPGLPAANARFLPLPRQPRCRNTGRGPAQPRARRCLAVSPGRAGGTAPPRAPRTCPPPPRWVGSWRRSERKCWSRRGRPAAGCPHRTSPGTDGTDGTGDAASSRPAPSPRGGSGGGREAAAAKASPRPGEEPPLHRPRPCPAAGGAGRESRAREAGGARGSGSRRWGSSIRAPAGGEGPAAALPSARGRRGSDGR